MSVNALTIRYLKHLLIKLCHFIQIRSKTMTEFKTPEPLSAKFEDTFAYKTVADRLPVIITKAIDTTCRQLKTIVELGIVGSDHQIEAEQEMKDAIGRLAKLRNELQTNKPFGELVSKASDIKIWNKYLNDYKNEFRTDPLWFECQWLYAECYLYRRVREAFELTKYIKSYDPFCESKEEALKTSMTAIDVLANSLSALKAQNNFDIETEFIKYIELSLWGNKCDLSLSAGKQMTGSLNPTEDLVKLKDKIIVNQIKNLWNYVKTCSANVKDIQLSLVLDNSGFELFTDLCLIEFFHLSRLLGDKSVVKIYVKSIPWFVSDVMTKDFFWLLNYLANDSNIHSQVVKDLAKKWINYTKTGKWVIIDNNFWTLPQDFSQMKAISPDLYQSLSETNLIIFKGDLNYRKLTADLNWKLDVPFETALRGFLPTTLCSLRTIKADVVVGVEDKQILEKIKTFPNNWRETGEYALIQVVRK